MKWLGDIIAWGVVGMFWGAIAICFGMSIYCTINLAREAWESLTRKP